MEEWKEYKAKDFCTSVTDDTHDSPKPKSFGHYLITSKHLKDNRIDYSTANPISEEDYQKVIQRSAVEQYDILFSMIGTIGNVVQVKLEQVDFAVKNMGIFKMGKEPLKSYWLYYWLKSDFSKEYINQRLAGSTQSYLTLDSLRNYPILYPGDHLANKIVSILKSLDDKIENNRKINENLEQQAQALFKSWFVDFEPFRGQPFVESELGMIPEGWRVGTLSEIAEYSKSRISIKDIDTQTYVSTENMLANKQGITEASGLPNVENVTRFEKGDVLISNIRPYFKKLNYCNHIGGCSGDVMCFHPLSKEYRGYLYCSLYDDVFFDYVMSGTKGTKMPRGDKRQIMNYRIFIPSHSIIDKFNRFILSLLSMIDNNRKESRRLSQLRDTLLPKLMSGEIKL